MARNTFVLGAAVALSLLIPAAAVAKPLRVGVTAIGTGHDSDKAAAINAAKENARGSLVCAGSLESVDANSTGCLKTGGDDSPTFICTAVARGTCVMGE
jgi:hypothetical protein